MFAARVWKDAHGHVLLDRVALTVIEDLKIEGCGSMQLKSGFINKA